MTPWSNCSGIRKKYHQSKIRALATWSILVAYAKNIAGLKFGRLLALRIIGKAGRENVWACACECGNLCEVRISNLCSGNTRSCGCKKIGARD